MSSQRFDFCPFRLTTKRRQLASFFVLDWKPLSLHLHDSNLALKFNKLITAFALVILMAGCAGGKLVSVVVEDKAGNTELVYRKVQSPENLVKEIRFYPSGDTLSVTPMLKGAVHGVVSFYYKNNLLKEQATFVYGKQDGPFKKFDKNGVLVFEGSLKNGLKSGNWRTWYDEVQVQEERSYTNDMPNGKWTYWYIDGSLKREETYKDGKLLDAKDF